jgi:23S rRNA pseudouridine2605 synthase
MPTDSPASPPGDRVAKVLARAGVCSRREAEKLIAAGRVAVNGTVLEGPAHLVTARDVVTVDGAPIPQAEDTRLWRFHKPPGLVTTNRDPQGRPTVFDHLPADLPRVMTVGRLDLSSEGLLLLTNDGALARHLEHPDTGWVRRYRVRVHGRVEAARLEGLADGVTVEGIRYGPIRAALERQQGANAWITVALREGRNREVRRVMEHLGWSVTRLIRIGYGPFILGPLARSAVEEVPRRQMRDLLGSGWKDGAPGKGWAKAGPARRRHGGEGKGADKKRPPSGRTGGGQGP